MKRVAIFRSQLLPLSETFIRDQALALTTWKPVLVGLNDVADGLRTSGIAREVIRQSDSRIDRAVQFWLQRPIPQLVTKLRELQCSLVHAHFGMDATLAWPSVNACKLPMLVTLHGWDINIHRQWWERGHGGLRGIVYPSRLLRLAVEPSVHFIAVSEAIRHRAIEFGIPAEKISVSYIGVDTARFKPSGSPLSQRANRVLFVGRMVEKKSPLLVVRAFAELRNRLPDAELVMIGDGPLRASAERMAAELSTPVTFLGASNADTVRAQLALAKAFCLPSHTAANGDAEGLPISILESIASGVPVVTTRHSGNPEPLDTESTDVLIEEPSVTSLQNALFDVLTRAEPSRVKATDRLTEFKARFEIRSTSRVLETLYGSLSH